MNGKCDKCKIDTEVYFVGDGREGTDQELVCNDCFNTCPHCERMYTEWPALSRRDNKTLICSACGTREALEDYEASKNA